MAVITLRIPRKVEKAEFIPAHDSDKSIIDTINIRPRKPGKTKAQPSASARNDDVLNFKEDFSESLPLETDSAVNLTLEEIQKEIQDAYNQGFADGQETTRASFQTQIQQHQKWLKNLDSVIADLRSQYSNTIAGLENSVVDLAIMVAEHILDHEASQNSGIVVEQTRKAIQSLDNDVIFKIRIHPQNIEILERAKSILLTDASVTSEIQIVSDSSVDIAGCILETSAGTVDARIQTQLRRIKSSLNELSPKAYQADDFAPDGD